MGSRKESLKKSLGITEYPWSSDEEENSSNLMRRPSTEPRTSIADTPGTSGVTTQNPFVPVPPRRNVVGGMNGPENNWFWSNNRNNHHESLINGSSRPRLCVQEGSMPLPYLRPANHVPAAELHERNTEAAMTANADIQRIIAFKKFARNYNNVRDRRRVNTLYAISSRVAGNLGSDRIPFFPMPSTSDASNATCDQRAMKMNNPRQNHMRQYRPLYCRVGDPSTSSLALEDGPPDIGCVSQIRLMRSNTAVDLSNTAPANATAELNVDIGRSDDEAEAESEPTLMLVNNDQNDGQEQSAEPSTSHDPTPGGAMEEEIVELDAPDDDTNEEGENNVANDVVMTNAATASNEDDTPESPEAEAEGSAPEPQPHGVKRKKSGNDEAGFFSVKDFNQGLLRLLECPVCLEWMEPPIAQCRRGHLVCVRCRSRLNACPVCRTVFSSVRNRAMEGVAEMLRYPCRHGCGREVRLRRRAPHEASCAARRYHCPAPACRDAPALPHAHLAHHFQSKHMSMLKMGRKHQFSIKVNVEQHEDCVIMALDQLFHLKVDVDIRTWGIIIYVAFIGPKSKASNYTYEVVVNGQHNSRKLVYTRVTHSDLESSSVNVSRQDCFHLTLDQALNFLRVKNKQCEPDKYLEFNLEIAQCDEIEANDSES
ncbi:uncharacterized protein LOC114247601 [Bombyx mandarina]|uniref:E3 ubiquitin-protein ligase n=1 Tax=Bombyx mandarina TaxID=7092 RepID=A0A6J2K7Y9_BOMMA|nr:uncharacterized protein LOC114247601 [Bombyx mandarina]